MAGGTTKLRSMDRETPVTRTIRKLRIKVVVPEIDVDPCST